jgi:hypothetical protein
VSRVGTDSPGLGASSNRGLAAILRDAALCGARAPLRARAPQDEDQASGNGRIFDSSPLLRALHHRLLDGLFGVAEIVRGVDQRDVGQRLGEIPGLAADA